MKRGKTFEVPRNLLEFPLQLGRFHLPIIGEVRVGVLLQETEIVWDCKEIKRSKDLGATSRTRSLLGAPEGFIHARLVLLWSENVLVTGGLPKCSEPCEGTKGGRRGREERHDEQRNEGQKGGGGGNMR